MKLIYFLFIFMSLQAFAQSGEEVSRIISTKSDLYQVLGLNKDATQAEVKTAYRKLVSKFHPDRYQNNPNLQKMATQAMTRLNDAVEVLSDNLKRTSYDVTLSATRSANLGASNTAKATGGWKKWTFTDFAKNKKTSEKASPKPEPEKAKATASEPELKTKAEPRAKAEAPPPPSSSHQVKNVDRPATSYTAKQAQKVYAESARCGMGYYSKLIDELL